MTCCNDCGHPQASHHGHFGACTHLTAFVLGCTCPKYVPQNAFDPEAA